MLRHDAVVHVAQRAVPELVLVVTNACVTVPRRRWNRVLRLVHIDLNCVCFIRRDDFRLDWSLGQQDGG